MHLSMSQGEFPDLGGEPKAAEAHGAAGHRARLRARLLGGGAEALADYEAGR